MASIDIFNDNAFGLVELTAALSDVEYLPQQLGAMNIFTEKSVRTTTVTIERQETKLNLVQTSPRGAPLEPAKVERRNIRDFRTVRLAKSDHLEASEIQDIRAFGTDSEFMQVQQEVLTRATNLRNDLELTHEHMRLGAVQGQVLDADGTVLYDWFTEWGITQPAEISFSLTGDLIDGKFREACNKIIRQMQRAAKGAWSPATRVVALCGDEFYDALIRNVEVRQIWIAQQNRAGDLSGTLVMPWDSVDFGGILWINYRGTDDNSKVAIPSQKVKFFPMNAPNAFLRVNGPGEFFDTINQPGQEYYALTIPDEKRNAFVDIELYSYPLYVATRPQMLLRGKLV